MKILLISVKSKKSYGGIAVWTENFLNGCKKKSIDVDVVNTEVTGIRLNDLTARRNILDEYRRTKRIFSDLIKCLKNSPDHYDAAHLNTSCGTFGLIRDLLIAMYIRKKKIPLATHFHCDIPHWIKNPYSKIILKKLVKMSTKNIVLCENSRKYLKDKFDVSSVIIPNFVSDSLVMTQPKIINEELRKIVFVGRVSKAKGAPEIYELASRLPHITFELIGEVSEDMTQFTKPQNVVLLGSMPHEELIRRIDLADLFVFPSHSEGFSLALTEAMARGLPCVATDVGANADMLSEGCGYIVEIGDVDAMEMAIEHLTPYVAREQMSKKAIQKVRREYIVDSVVNKIKELYKINNV